MVCFLTHFQRIIGGSTAVLFGVRKQFVVYSNDSGRHLLCLIAAHARLCLVIWLQVEAQANERGSEFLL